jgi:hypothetical protein
MPHPSHSCLTGGRRHAAAAVLCLLLAACGDGHDAEGPQQVLDHKTVDAQRYSGITEARTVVIADAAAWAALWEHHVREQNPVPRAPSVDFSQQMVLGVFIGQRADSCSMVTVQKIYRTATRLVAEYSETAADAGASCAAVTTHPSHLVVVPRGPGPVEFVRSTAGRG